MAHSSQLTQIISVPRCSYAGSSLQALAARSFSAHAKTSQSNLQVGHNVPAVMKYMAHDSAAGPESLTVQECETPQYDKDKEVLIKVEATAANRADLLQVSGGKR